MRTSATLMMLGEGATPSWRPFLDPIDVHSLWFLLLVPLALLVALSYKAARVADVRQLPRQTLILGLQIIFGMIGLGAGFYLFVNFILPLVAPRS